MQHVECITMFKSNEYTNNELNNIIYLLKTDVCKVFLSIFIESIIDKILYFISKLK